jgi:hypothetical protein
MSATTQVRSLRPSSKGWTDLQTAASPASDIRPVPFAKLAGGAGQQASFLENCFIRFVLGEMDTASGLGWEFPPTTPIHVALAGRPDADWVLDEAETAF